MHGLAAAVVAFGVLLLFWWLCWFGVIMTQRDFGWQNWQFGYSEEWAGMVLGFLKQRDCKAIFFVVTAVLSGIGWVMAWDAVQKVIDKEGQDDKHDIHVAYMAICLVQVLLLLIWTLLTTCIRTIHHISWRKWNVAVLWILALFYFIGWILWMTTSTGVSKEQYEATVVFLLVHVIHGVWWDCWTWGRGYINYEYKSTTNGV